MFAQVTNDKKDGGSNSSYDLFLNNITDNKQCTLLNKSANYGDPKYSLYVYERVKVGSTLTKLAQISDITNVYGSIYYAGSSKGIYTPYNNGWYNNYEMWTSYPAGTQNADATVIASNSKFTFDWITSSGTN